MKCKHISLQKNCFTQTTFPLWESYHQLQGDRAPYTPVTYLPCLLRPQLITVKLKLIKSTLKGSLVLSWAETFTISFCLLQKKCDEVRSLYIHSSISATMKKSDRINFFITPILKSMVVPVILLALISAIYSRIALFFALNRIFFPANREATLKTKQPIRFQGLFKVTHQIAGK